tara:strand:- start:2105 stop:2941 length:837 start_codon:yes stop_codon:yes gene_type:complete
MTEILKSIRPMKYILLVLFLTCSIAFAKAKPKKVYMSVEYTSFINDSRLIQLSTKARVDGKFQNLSGMPLEIYMVTEQGDSLLTKLTTDENGEAMFLIAEDYKFSVNEKGVFILKAIFPGNKEYKKATKKVKAKDLYLNAKFLDQDGKHKIQISASDINSSEDEGTYPKINLEIAIKRLFADLKVGSVKLENGKAEFIFDEKIPGINEGELEILIKVVDNRTYKNVIFSNKMNWGQKITINDPTERDMKGIPYLAFMILSLIVVSIVGILYHKQQVKN